MLWRPSDWPGEPGGENADLLLSFTQTQTRRPHLSSPHFSLKQRRAYYHVMVQLKITIFCTHHITAVTPLNTCELIWTLQWDVIAVSVRTIKAFGRNDTKQKITKNISTGKKKKKGENDPSDTACNLRAALSQWDLNCTADAFSLTFAFGAGCGGCGTSCSASHTACIEMNCSLGVDKSPWHTTVTMETTQTQHFWGNK